MVLAAVRDNTYNVVLLVHVVAFLVAFAPAAINPLLDAHLRADGQEASLRSFASFAARYTRVATLGGMGVLLLTGILMVLLSDEVWEFSQTWISLAFLVWFALAGVISAMILKGEREAAAGDLSALDRVATGGKVATVLTLVMLYLMVFKPGL